MTVGGTVFVLVAVGMVAVGVGVLVGGIGVSVAVAVPVKVGAVVAVGGAAVGVPVAVGRSGVGVGEAGNPPGPEMVRKTASKSAAARITRIPNLTARGTRRGGSMPISGMGVGSGLVGTGGALGNRLSRCFKVASSSVKLAAVRPRDMSRGLRSASSGGTVACGRITTGRTCLRNRCASAYSARQYGASSEAGDSR